jgi:MoaA/NifB/PqqE/SkfB family radical SAM enzyme
MMCPQQRLLLMLPDVLGLHIEPTNICTLKCSGCARTIFLKQWPQHWQNHNLDIDSLMAFLDVDLQNKTLLLGGNYGDPIYHPEFIELVKKLKSRGANLKIITNGSYRTVSWWQSLVESLSVQDTVIFSIDGVPENFVQYRENADWDTILQGIQICVNSQARVAWKYIPFSFNQHDIEQAQKHSEDLGIDSFFIDPSKRFDDSPTQAIMPNTHLVNLEFESRVNWKHNQISDVDPKCHTGQEHFITADGYYTPCCFVADHRWLYKTQFGKQREQYHISNTTLSALLKRPQILEFYKNLSKHPVCQFSCPNTSG